jgi:hypothetical protein
MSSVISDAIIQIIEQHGDEVHGTAKLADDAGCVNQKSYLIKCAHVLQSNGQIVIIPSRGGRGRKTVYKRNRNQPGLPRKKQR